VGGVFVRRATKAGKTKWSFPTVSEESAISRPPSGLQLLVDRSFRGLCQVFAWLTVIMIVFIVVRIFMTGFPAMRQYGLGFLTGTTWDPNQGKFGILPEIWGTLYSSILALILGTAFGTAAAIFLSEGYFSEFIFNTLKIFKLQFHPFWRNFPQQVEDILKNLIELLAAIPSVVYGLWGLFVVIPLLRPACNWLHTEVGWMPIFGTDLSGPGMLPAAIVLSIMILPTITAISRDALVAVPPKLRMAAYGLGATRWETILAVILPTASRGIFGGVVLAFGRALGETMALAMLVGNSNRISVSLFSPANTLAALLANTFPEAKPSEVAVLMYAALVLLAITLVVNILGAMILQRASLQTEGGH
jgi:phosphate transport system permease protein